MLHASVNGAKILHLADEQLPLGLLAGPPYEGHAVEAQPGDIFLVATDGILEATDKTGEEFGLIGLERILSENRLQPLTSIAEKIHTALAASYTQEDDQSLLLIRVK